MIQVHRDLSKWRLGEEGKTLMFSWFVKIKKNWKNQDFSSYRSFWSYFLEYLKNQSLHKTNLQQVLGQNHIFVCNNWISFGLKKFWVVQNTVRFFKFVTLREYWKYWLFWEMLLKTTLTLVKQLNQRMKQNWCDCLQNHHYKCFWASAVFACSMFNCDCNVHETWDALSSKIWSFLARSSTEELFHLRP